MEIASLNAAVQVTKVVGESIFGIFNALKADCDLAMAFDLSKEGSIEYIDLILFNNKDTVYSVSLLDSEKDKIVLDFFVPKENVIRKHMFRVVRSYHYRSARSNNGKTYSNKEKFILIIDGTEFNIEVDLDEIMKLGL